MQRYRFLRDLVLVAIAMAVGWWIRGANSPVLAERGGSSSAENLAFQVIGTGPDSTVAMYNPATRSLYVYASAGGGSSSVPCTYSFQVSAPGLPLARTNCAPGELR